MQGAARVNIKEIDLSTTVPSFAGIYGAIVIPAKKGLTDEPQFVTSDTQLLNSFTPEGTVKIGYDLSYYSALAFLQKSQTLYVKRAVPSDAYFAGAVIKLEGATGDNAEIADDTNLSDPSAFVLDDTIDNEDAMLVYSSSVGAWGDGIGIKITNYSDDPDAVGEPGAFLLEVFHSSNTVTPLESFICSRDEAAKDGFGRNIFVEDVLNSSNYIRVENNEAVEGNPKSQSTVLFLNDGDDGSAITDSGMISAAQAFANPEEIYITLFMDGGYAVPGYQVALDTIVSNRQDSVAILSTPYSDEVSATYINDLLDYRKTDLNLNSSYSALYTPHVRITDRFNDRQIFVSPDGYAAGAISQTFSNYEAWYPAAGFKRGVLNVEGVSRKFTEAEVGQLYNAGMNPVRFFAGEGIVIWGQKTLLSRPSSLSRLNVRMLLIVIEPALKQFLRQFLFDLNDIATRNIIKALIDSYMAQIKSRRGVTDFLVVCDSSNNAQADVDANRLNVDVYLKPTQSVEEINLRIVITAASISFELAQEQL